MMIKIILTVLFILFILDVRAQHTKTAELKPIHRQGGRYFYDFRRVDGGAYGLQIPLQSLGDDEVNIRYKKFKSLRTLEGIFSIAPLLYLFTQPSYGLPDYETFWIVYGGSFAGILLVEIGAKAQLRKGIDRYNRLILEPSGKAAGLSITFKF